MKFLKSGGDLESSRWCDPYTPLEALGLIKRNLLGPPKVANPSGFLSKMSTLNAITPQLKVGFTGDAMMMFGKPLSFDESIKRFYADCDALVVNMEGVITDHPKRGPDQKHGPEIIEQLATLFDPAKTWLSHANNHAADFGLSELESSINRLTHAGFNCFGLSDSVTADISPNFRVTAGTQWSNRYDEGRLSWLKSVGQECIKPGAFNLLLPHYSYEMEIEPRELVKKQVTEWLAKFDAVVGHHSHTPQPVTDHLSADQSVRQLIAYSLGDLCFGVALKNLPALKHYCYGIALKFEVGPLISDPTRYAVGSVEWQWVDCDATREGGQRRFVTRLVEDVPYF